MMKNVFYVTLKALFVLEIIKLYFFRYSNAMTSSSAWAWSMKHILLNNFNFCAVKKTYRDTQNKTFHQIFFEKCGLETSSEPFLNFKESSVKINLRRILSILIVLLLHMLYKQVASKITFLNRGMVDSLQTQKSMELVFMSQFLYNFFSFVIWHKLAKRP